MTCNLEFLLAHARSNDSISAKPGRYQISQDLIYITRKDLWLYAENPNASQPVSLDFTNAKRSRWRISGSSGDIFTISHITFINFASTIFNISDARLDFYNCRFVDGVLSTPLISATAAVLSLNHCDITNVISSSITTTNTTTALFSQVFISTVNIQALDIYNTRFHHNRLAFVSMTGGMMQMLHSQLSDNIIPSFGSGTNKPMIETVNSYIFMENSELKNNLVDSSLILVQQEAGYILMSGTVIENTTTHMEGAVINIAKGAGSFAIDSIIRLTQGGTTLGTRAKVCPSIGSISSLK